jgi:putative ABC transport system permease protein
MIDARPVRRRAVRFVPWELVPVAAAVLAFGRLDRIGGIQQIGASVAHADLGAQSFPLLAVVAPLAALARPTVLALRRARLFGRNLPPSALTGLRRALAEPAVTTGILLATALAGGSFTLARTLTDSTAVLLHDKASTYIGSDLALTTRDVRPLPAALSANGTVVVRAEGHSGEQSVDVLGVDPVTFARAVHWRDDAGPPLRDLLATLDAPSAASGAMPAVVVGGALPDPHLVSVDVSATDVRAAATARWFPGFRNGAVLVVVDRERLLASGLRFATEIWLRDPPPDARGQLTAAGITARSPLDLALVFDVTSFVTVRWAYATLSVLAVLIGVVVLLTQLLVLDARRQSRAAAHVLTSRMGFGRGAEAIGLAAEVAPPLVVGATIGIGIGWLVARLSVARLDSLRQLQPPARLAVAAGSVAPMLLAVVGAIGVLVLVGLLMSVRTRPMEVMRGTA